MASLSEGFSPRSSRSRTGRNIANTLLADTRPSASTKPVFFRTNFSLYNFSIVLLFATTFPSAISADANFTLDSSSYKCGSNLICLGQAHEYPGSSTSRIQDPKLSLIWERSSGQRADIGAGIAYYKQPVRLKEPSTNQSASFSTNFSMDVVMVHYPRHGDGMAFVISADNETLGEERMFLGIFDGKGITSFKSIVVEFDLYQDPSNSPATYDINDNHVSFDFSNISTTIAANASNVDVELWKNTTTYVWVDYSDEAHQLEVRVSHNNSRPTSPLLTHTLDLSEVVEEYMFVGFSAGSGDYYSNYYIGNWSFQSSGIRSYSSPFRTRISKSDGHKLGLLFGIAVSVPTLILACILVSVLLQPREESGQVRVYHINQLSEATYRFNRENKIGEGGFGTVYRGVLRYRGMRSDIPVAVKEIGSDSAQGQKEFMAEVSIISQLSHKNLIKLKGFCTHRNKYLLVYELMLNGSLDKLLFPAVPPSDHQTSALSWPQKLHILTRTAAAIHYLHHGWKQGQVIHRDIKSSNIMLDKKLNPKLGDFGLALLVDHHKEASTTILAGTCGYLAPELCTVLTLSLRSGKFTVKTDVYAFGVVVLEVACGRRALFRSDGSERPPDTSLANWAWNNFSNGNDLLSIVDRRLNNSEYDPHRMEVLLRLGLVCCHFNPSARPSMQQVVQILSGVREAPLHILANISTSRPVPVPLHDFSSDPVSSSLIDEPSDSDLLIGEPSQILDHNTVRNGSWSTTSRFLILSSQATTMLSRFFTLPINSSTEEWNATLGGQDQPEHSNHDEPLLTAPF